MLPHHEGKKLDRDGMLEVLRRLDAQLAAREKDIADIARFVPSPNVVPLDELRRRYERIVPAEGKEEIVKNHLLKQVA